MFVRGTYRRGREISLRGSLFAAILRANKRSIADSDGDWAPAPLGRGQLLHRQKAGVKRQKLQSGKRDDVLKARKPRPESSIAVSNAAERQRGVEVLRQLNSRNESAEASHPIDCHVGRRIRLRRAQLRLSQSDLGARIGVSFQAVQKYESGAIRISASRLYEMALALAVTPGFFFADYAGGPEAGGS